MARPAALGQGFYSSRRSQAGRALRKALTQHTAGGGTGRNKGRAAQSLVSGGTTAPGDPRPVEPGHRPGACPAPQRSPSPARGSAGTTTGGVPASLHHGQGAPGVCCMQRGAAGQDTPSRGEALAVRVGAEQLSPGARAALCRSSKKQATEHHSKQGAGARQSKGQILKGIKGSEGAGQDLGIPAAVSCLRAQGPGKSPTAKAAWGSPKSRAQPLQASKCPVRRLLGAGREKQRQQNGSCRVGRSC